MTRDLDCSHSLVQVGQRVKGYRVIAVWNILGSGNDNISDIRVVSLLPHVPTLHFFVCVCVSVCVCMYLFVARVCNVSTLLVCFVSMCVWGRNHYVVRTVSEE